MIPLGGSASLAGTCLVVFEDSTRAHAALSASTPNLETESRERPRAEIDQELAQASRELAATREYLQDIIQQQEAANEELQTAHEEAQSANEELQSINEELETSKEEIQSSNEELATVNDELNHRNRELGRTINDLTNLLAGGEMAIIMLGPDLRIRRFTPLAERLFNLIPADEIGRASCRERV